MKFILVLKYPTVSLYISFYEQIGTVFANRWNEPKRFHSTDKNVKDDSQIERVLDLRGWSCPWCILKAKSWLTRMKPGQILEFYSTDPETLKNFPSILRSGNDRVIEVKQYPDYHRMLIRRG